MILNEDNPYKEDIKINKTIIDIKGDYVQYIDDNKDTLSSHKMFFVISSTCVKNCN